jgi:hypothetical protein
MKSLGVRLVLLLAAIGAQGAAGYFLITHEQAASAERSALELLDARAREMVVAANELLAASQASVAIGQGQSFWATRAAAALGTLKDQASAAREAVHTSKGLAALDELAKAIERFEKADARARKHIAADQRLLASDIIYSDGLDSAAAINTSIEEARRNERDQRLAELAAAGRSTLYTLGGAALMTLLVLLMLVAGGRAEGSRAGFASEAAAPPDEADEPAARIHLQSGLETDFQLPLIASKRTVEPETPGSAPASEPAPATGPDIAAAAELCTELARVVDAGALEALVARAATILDASGIIVWAGSGTGGELKPVLTHGYTPQAVARMGAIASDGDNATAAAFREGRLRTVARDGFSDGAIVAPIVAPGGCVGVMAAEVRNGGEGNAATQAVATIFAAQLATLLTVGT